MKSNYFEKKENRINIAEELAAKNEQASTNALNHSHKLANMVPMGQPILVGHHSEGMARNHVKILNNLKK